MEAKPRKAHASDVNDEQWASAATCLTLITEDAPLRVCNLREANASKLVYVQGWAGRDPNSPELC